VRLHAGNHPTYRRLERAEGVLAVRAEVVSDSRKAGGEIGARDEAEGFIAPAPKGWKP